MRLKELVVAVVICGAINVEGICALPKTAEKKSSGVTRGEAKVGELVSFESGEWCLGLAFKYPDGSEVWLSPSSRGPYLGSNENVPTIAEVERAWKERFQSFTKPIPTAQNIHVSNDGRFVYFSQSGVFGPVMYEYSVDKRRVRKVGKVARD